MEQEVALKTKKTIVAKKTSASKKSVTKEAPKKEKSEIQQAYDHLDDPKIEQNLLNTALYLQKRFRGNSFTLLKIMKKTPIKNSLEARQVLNSLSLKGLLTQERRGNEDVYRIVISKERQVDNLQKQLVQLKEQTAIIEKKIETLLSKESE